MKKGKGILGKFLLWEEGKISSHEFCVQFSEVFKENISGYRKHKLALKKKIKRYMVKSE